MVIFYEIKVQLPPHWAKAHNLKNSYQATRRDYSIAVGKPGWWERIGTFDTRREAIAYINAQKKEGEVCEIKTRYP